MEPAIAPMSRISFVVFIFFEFFSFVSLANSRAVERETLTS